MPIKFLNKISAKGGSASRSGSETLQGRTTGGKKILIPIITAINLGMARFASAELTNPLQSNTFADLIANIAKIVAQIGLPVAVIAIIYAGFLFATARGNEEQIKTAKKAFLWSVIGTALLLGAWAIATAIQQFLGTL